MTDTLPAALAEIRDEFLDVAVRDRLLLLLDYAGTLPELPDQIAAQPAMLERVVECQAPVFVIAQGEGGVVRVYATAPMEAPTTRGFASILVHGLDGLTVPEVLSVPEDFPFTIGLAEAVSPLRMRGMQALLGRIKRQLRVAAAA